MDAKEAAKSAKEYIVDIFDVDEEVDRLGLEEVKFDELTDVWEITIGFFRPWQRSDFALLTPTMRTYKLVRIHDSDGRITSVTNRALTAADSA